MGSFLNVCIYRIPLKRSIVSPPSECPYCGEKIRPYDNIPLFSYLFLKGKCRYCRNHISWQYPAVEVLTGLLSLFSFIRYGLTYQYFLVLFLLGVLLTISFIDLYHKIIPDILTLPGIVAGWASSFVFANITWLDSFIGIMAGGGSLFVVAFVYERITGREGMGGGDVKMLAMIGAWMGWRPLPLIVLISSLTGTLIGLAFILLAGKEYRFKIPFGPFLAFGTVIYLFFGPELTGGYFRLL